MWQDDPATIHRAAVSVEAVKDTFRKRVPHEIQAPKMADCWPIENVWSIIKDKVSEDDPQTKPQLKRSITKSWKSINDDKALCKKLIESIPKRLEAVIRKNGEQVRKEDYKLTSDC